MKIDKTPVSTSRTIQVPHYFPTRTDVVDHPPLSFLDPINEVQTNSGPFYNGPGHLTYTDVTEGEVVCFKFSGQVEFFFFFLSVLVTSF